MIILPRFTRSLSSMNPTVCFSLQNQLHLVFRIIFCLFCLFAFLFTNIYTVLFDELLCHSHQTTMLQQWKHCTDKQVPKIIFKSKKLRKYMYLPAGKLQKFRTKLYESAVLKYSVSLKVLCSSTMDFI